VQSLQWEGRERGILQLLDQTQLPGRVEYLPCRTADDVWHAIKRLSVRGAPAIGIAAAYGVVLGAQPLESLGPADRASRVHAVCDYLATSRPTAVNLFWAIERMRATADRLIAVEPAKLLLGLWQEAVAIHGEDRELCKRIGRTGGPLLRGCKQVLTHCNAGGLATAESGTALAVICEAHTANPQLHVWVDETRPLMQGARLTSWELQQANVPCTLITDSMAGAVMQQGLVDAVVVGADRIAANGDVANKIGTYGLARLAEAHGIPFFVAAPHSTFDRNLPSGDLIPIEERAADEVAEVAGQRIAPQGIAVYNPAFDVTPARFVTAIITDRGIIQPVDNAAIDRVLGQ